MAEQIQLLKILVDDEEVVSVAPFSQNVTTPGGHPSDLTLVEKWVARRTLVPETRGKAFAALGRTKDSPP